MASLTLTQPCDRLADLEVLYLIVWGDLRDETNLDHPWSTTVRSTAGSELCRVVAATFFSGCLAKECGSWTDLRRCL